MKVVTTLDAHPNVDNALRMECYARGDEVESVGVHLDVMKDVATPEVLAGMYISLLGELHEKLDNSSNLPSEEG